MSEEASNLQTAPLSPDLYMLVGNIASDWATLEYLVNDCIWTAAQVDQQLGACITAQIFSLPPKLDALVLLLRARGASQKTMRALNDFIQDLRGPTELRNRAIHDPLGVHAKDGKERQLQITARGKLVFELREITATQLAKDRDTIARFLERFMRLRGEIEAELETLPYTPQPLFPRISRGPW